MQVDVIWLFVAAIGGAIVATLVEAGHEQHYRRSDVVARLRRRHP